LKIGIIGAGLGGLLAGVALQKKGFDVVIFERLSQPGGRFTNYECKGFQLSTGALHMIPHGENGPLGRMLKSLDADVEIIPSKPEGYFRINGEDYLFTELKSLLSLPDRIRTSLIFTLLKFSRGGKESYREWLENKINNPLVFQIADSFCGWSLSLSASDVSSRELISIAKNIYRRGGPGIPLGGCGGVTNALVQEFENLGGRIRYKETVKGIITESREAKGIIASEKHQYDIIISNIGPKATIRLCDKGCFDELYIKKIEGIREAAGIKISIACEKPMLGHSGVLFTPQAKRIDGLNEVTNVDPSLAPEGKHLLMSHQSLKPGKNIKEEVRLAKEDLRNLFPDFDSVCKILAVQVYRGGWPVNRAPSGVYVDPVSPLRGLYYVGDAIKPEGWMETDGVAAGALEVLRAIEDQW
jgi:phytoene dehydrogenase-like protein